MSITTVRVIFWGLVGLVPNEDVKKGMTVLFADPGTAHHQSQNSECQIPPHVSFAFLLKGECVKIREGCHRVPSHQHGM